MLFVPYKAIFQLIASAALGILVVALGYGLDINFLYKKLAATQRQVATLKEQVRLAQQKLTLLPVSPVKQSGEKTIRLVPELEVVDILSILEKEIVAAKIAPGLFEPGRAQENGKFIVYPIKLELVGEYKNLLMFINNLLKDQSLITIEELSLQKKKEEGGDNLHLQVLVVFYKSKHVYERNSKEVSIPVFERDLFKPGVGKKDLFLWSSQELNFFGLMKQAGIVFGVIGDPVGNIYRVKVGDSFGLNRSVITAISECGVKTARQADNIQRGGKCI